MKYRTLLCLMLTLFLLLTACGGAPTVYEKNGYTVDLENQTITRGEDVYTFVISTNSSSTYTQITYPNGIVFSWTQSANSGHGGYSGGLDEADYVEYADGLTLVNLLDLQSPRQRMGSPLLGLLVIASGIFSLAAPQTAWHLSYGWRFKNAEPSDAALAAERIGGVALLLLGLALLFL